MIVKLFTITDEGQDEVWIDAYIDENKINVGWRIPAYIDENKINVGWRIPAYIDDELDLVVYTDELNLFIGGQQITVKSTAHLLEILKERLA